jgi:hypothetical protein
LHELQNILLLMFERWNCSTDRNNFTQNIFFIVSRKDAKAQKRQS